MLFGIQTLRAQTVRVLRLPHVDPAANFPVLNPSLVEVLPRRFADEVSPVPAPAPLTFIPLSLVPSAAVFVGTVVGDGLAGAAC